MKQFDFSIVIVTHNGLKYIDACVNSIYSSNIKNFEIIVVDNGSCDGTVKFLKNKYKQNTLKIVELDKNYGPAKARNQGVKEASGKYLGFLDNDTIVQKDWSNEAKKAFENDDKLGIVQCRLMLNRERTKIDYIGEYLGSNGFLVQRVPAGTVYNKSFDKEEYILAAKSAGMFIRKKTFDEIGGFDDSYFIYVEETDLGWRSWLVGYTAKFIPNSIVYHEFGTSTVILGTDKANYNAKFHGTKNYIQTLIKNLDPTNLKKILPLHVILWMGLSVHVLLKGQWRASLWILEGIFWNLTHLSETLEKRNFIQQNRKVSDKELFKTLMVKKPFSYFLSKAVTKQKIGNAESFSKLGNNK